MENNENNLFNYELTDLGLFDLIKLVDKSKLEYVESKFKLEEVKSNLELTVNWNDINEERKKDDLPKIANKEQRAAFIKQCTIDREKETEMLYLKYQSFKRMYEVALHLGIDFLKD